MVISDQDYSEYVECWKVQKPGKTPPTKEQMESILELLELPFEIVFVKL